MDFADKLMEEGGIELAQTQLQTAETTLRSPLSLSLSLFLSATRTLSLSLSRFLPLSLTATLSL